MPWLGFHLDPTSTSGLTHLTPHSRPWLPSDPVLLGGEMWFCGFSFFYPLSKKGGKEEKGATTEQEMRHSTEQERSKWFSVDGNPILFLRPTTTIFGFVFKGSRW